MAEQYIFQMEGLHKFYNKREVLKNIWLSFYPGAKIGVIGSNGAGKSTLLRVMALQETDFIGSARLTPGFSVGFVPQEPRLTPDKTVLENIEEAVVETRALLKKQEDIGEKMATADVAQMDKLMAEMDRVQTAIDAADAYNLDRKLEAVVP